MKNTVTLVNTDDVRHFEVGEKARIEDLTEAEARAIFGDPVYESWLRHKDDPRPQGRCIITSIDADAGVITCSEQAPPEE